MWPNGVCRRFATVLTVALVWGLTSPARADDYQWTITGSVSSLRHAEQLSPVPEDQPLAVTIGLAWRNQDRLEQILNEITAPQSPRYEQYLSAEEFDADFAPTSAEVSALASYLEANGLTVTGSSPDRLLVEAAGSAGAIEKAFGTRLLFYRQGDDSFIAPESDPALPSAIGRRVLSIQGLETRTQMRSHMVTLSPGLQPHTAGVPYKPGNIAVAYGFSSAYDNGIRGDDSRAATIAVVTAHGFDKAAAGSFWRAFNLARPAGGLSVVSVGTPATETSLETTLDVEWAGAMAPGSPLVVYQSADTSIASFVALYDRAVADNRAAVITTSWGACEDSLPSAYLAQAHAIFQKATALGITVLAASGDAGAHDCGPGMVSVDFPASDPLVTAVGGTSLRLLPDGSYGSEDAWSDSGGGMSSYWSQPLWQSSAEARRGLSDVALNADPATGYYTWFDDLWWQVGGTSVAAPIWAAAIAMSNQARQTAGYPTLGLVAPRLCELARAGTPALRDIVRGGNGVYQAAAGWDYLTGWGTPDVGLLTEALASDLSPTGVDGGAVIATTIHSPAGTPPAPAGRVSFCSRCANSVLDLKLALDAGTYDLMIGSQMMKSFTTATSGITMQSIANVDARGKLVTVRRRGDADAMLSGMVPTANAPPQNVQMRLQPAEESAASGFARYRSRAGHSSFEVRVYGLPATEYALAVGRTNAGTFSVQKRGSRTIGIARFSIGSRSGAPLTFDPSCQTIIVSRKGVIYLQIPVFAEDPSRCG